MFIQNLTVDINSSKKLPVMCVAHVNDLNSRCIDVSVLVSNIPLDLTTYTATASYVVDEFVLNDSVDCEINPNENDVNVVRVFLGEDKIGNICSGIMTIEITLKNKDDENGEMKISPPFAIQVLVGKSNLKNAKAYNPNFSGLIPYELSKALSNKENTTNKVTSFDKLFKDPDKFPTVMAVMKYLEDYYYTANEIDGMEFDSHTPVKGVDYFTDEDKADFINQVILAIGTPVFGTIDKNNVITLSGNLANGEYVLKYEDINGETTEIGSVIVGELYNNLNNTTLATDSPLTPTSTGWMKNVRISSSSSSITSAESYDISNYVTIPADSNVVRIKNFNICNAYGRIYFYSNGTYKYQLSNISSTGAEYFTTVNEEYAEITVDKLMEVYKTSVGSTETFDSIRFGGILTGTIEDVIITIDEEI